MKRVHLLGSTGSIGTSTLRVLEELRETHRLVGMAAGTRSRELAEQAACWRPEAVAVVRDEHEALEGLAGQGIVLHRGADSARHLLEQVDADLVVNGITGAAGLEASLTALRRGMDLALANKESMVVAGPILARVAAEHGRRIIPVDSEHSAIYQCLQGSPMETVRRIILTASGGPFRTLPAEQLEQVTPAQALQHPTWDMGTKITIDSATLMNKALEVVEARWLFGLPREQVDVVVHPQSIVHSMVEFRDGSILAQLGVPDMAVPIRYALACPDRAATRESYFDLERFRQLTFEAPDVERFPALSLGFDVARKGGNAGAVFNAANEVAVDLFLNERISFPRIAATVAAALDAVPFEEEPTLDDLWQADRQARQEAMACCS